MGRSMENDVDTITNVTSDRTMFLTIGGVLLTTAVRK